MGAGASAVNSHPLFESLSEYQRQHVLVEYSNLIKNGTADTAAVEFLKNKYIGGAISATGYQEGWMQYINSIQATEAFSGSMIFGLDGAVYAGNLAPSRKEFNDIQIIMSGTIVGGSGSSHVSDSKPATNNPLSITFCSDDKKVLITLFSIMINLFSFGVLYLDVPC